MAVQDRFQNRFQQRCTAPRSMPYPSLSEQAHWCDNYQKADDNNAAVIVKKRKANLSYKRKLKCAVGKRDTERRRLIATKKKKEKARKNAIKRNFKLQSAVIRKNKSNDYFLPWDSSFECFFSSSLFLLDTTF